MRTRFSTLRRAAPLIAALLVTSAAFGVESASAAWTKVAVWEMNEGPGASTMHDSSGHHRTGEIGNLVMTGVVDGPYTGYQFADGPKNIERIVEVDRTTMNPRRDGFSVFLRLKTTATDGNIIQKGQANTAGGSWKIEMVAGHVICTFRGAGGRGAVGSRQDLATGTWHRVQCIRSRRQVSIIVDGGIPRKDRGRTGNIENAAALTIGGKKSCTAPNVSCQYYTGLLDRVSINRR